MKKDAVLIEDQQEAMKDLSLSDWLSYESL
jgi:hypothetical protein